MPRDRHIYIHLHGHAGDSAFKESDHPRAPDGKFGQGSGGAAKRHENTAASKRREAGAQGHPEGSFGSAQARKDAENAEALAARAKKASKPDGAASEAVFKARDALARAELDLKNAAPAAKKKATEAVFAKRDALAVAEKGLKTGKPIDTSKSKVISGITDTSHTDFERTPKGARLRSEITRLRELSNRLTDYTARTTAQENHRQAIHNYKQHLTSFLKAAKP